MNDQHIIHAYTIDAMDKSRMLMGEEISKTLKDDALAWVHLDGNNPKTKEWLETEITYLDDIIIDALLADETRPRILEYDTGVLMILRGVNLNENAAAEDMVSVRIWIDQNRIITIGRRPLRAIADIKNQLEAGAGPQNSGEFMCSLVARLFQRMETVFGELDEQLDNIEERIMEDPDPSDRQMITKHRKQVIIFRRYISPQRDVINYLKISEQKWLDVSHKRRLQESYDRILRYIEDLDTMRERAQIIKDELSSMLADKMNKNMYLLSIVAAIFLPLGFLTGLLGINVGGMPGADNGLAFWAVCGICVIFTAVIIGLFKRLKWL